MVKRCFVEADFPLTNETFYTDPTYYWYRNNFMDLHKISQNYTYNCTEGGILFGDNLECMFLSEYLDKFV